MRKPAPGSPAALALFAWLSPSFPIGSFAYSHGLEWAHEAGDIVDGATLEAWLRDLLEHGSLRNDAILLAVAYRAVQGEDETMLIAAAELSVALAPTAERHLETVQQGNAFLKTVSAAWPCTAVAWFGRVWDREIGLPVAVGVAAAGHAAPLAMTLEIFALAFASNLVSAAIRLGLIGQTEGQRLLAVLTPQCREVARLSIHATLDDLGSCTFRTDIASACHETQYTRLFRS